MICSNGTINEENETYRISLEKRNTNRHNRFPVQQVQDYGILATQVTQTAREEKK